MLRQYKLLTLNQFVDKIEFVLCKWETRILGFIKNVNFNIIMNCDVNGDNVLYVWKLEA